MEWEPPSEAGVDIIKSEDLFSCARILRSALPHPDYTASLAFDRAVVLSEEGEHLLQRIIEEDSSIPLADARLALFARLFHHGPLISLSRTDVAAVLFSIAQDLKDGRLMLPYRFGRLLYDRFNDINTTPRIERLGPREANALLADTPQGVYQLGTLVTGPFGILRSKSWRYVPPFRRLPLWHCEDTGCQALHAVVLQSFPVASVKAAVLLGRLCEEQAEPMSTWDVNVRGLFIEQGRRHGVGDYYDLPVVLAEALIEDERIELLAALLASESGHTIRTFLDGAGKSKGRPQEVAARIADVERLQLILLAPNDAIVATLDRLICTGIMKMSAQEVRRARSAPPTLTNREVISEISSLGIRPAYRVPILSITDKIWKAYERTSLTEELGWRLLRRSVKPPRSALLEKFRLAEPKEVIQELVLASGAVTRALSSQLAVDMEAHQESALVDIILWKAGFNVPRHEDTIPVITRRVKQFQETLFRIGVVERESQREEIRAAGVNLFVAVETFMQELVSYNVWLLSSDHFVGTQFIYRPMDGLRSVSTHIGEELKCGEEVVRWSLTGNNPLGTLMVYAEALAAWIKGLTHRDSNELARPEEELPYYAEDDERPFPFRHTQLWADADRTSLGLFAEEFSMVVTRLSQARVAAVRNGLDHKRSDDTFPTMDNMLLCATRLNDVVQQADALRLIPKSYWLKEKRSDRFGRVEYHYEDYSGRTLMLSGPPVVAGLPWISDFEPVLIAPGNLLAESTAELLFRVKQEGPYDAFWAGYPRRSALRSEQTGSSSDEVSDQVDDAELSQ